MDGQRFDNLSRGLAARLTRRRVVATALGLATAAIAGGNAAEAANRTCRVLDQKCVRNSNCCSNNCITSRAVRRTERNRCGCPIGMTRCGDACLDTQNDQNNCGACGNVCENYGPCVSGMCPDACTTIQYTGYEPRCWVLSDNRELQSCDHFYFGNLSPACDVDADCADFQDCGITNNPSYYTPGVCRCAYERINDDYTSLMAKDAPRGTCVRISFYPRELDSGVCER